jgi:CBS domain-containing protein
MSKIHRIDECMKRTIISARAEVPLREAAAILMEKKVGSLPIVDETGVLIGLITIREIMEIFLPDFVHLLDNIDFIKDYGARASLSTEDLRKVEKLTIADVMMEPFSVEEHASHIRAMSVMHKHNMLDLPVVKDGKLVGIVSWVDIGCAFIADWLQEK